MKYYVGMSLVCAAFFAGAMKRRLWTAMGLPVPNPRPWRGER